jgi:hypothetical protein
MVSLILREIYFKMDQFIVEVRNGAQLEQIFILIQGTFVSEQRLLVILYITYCNKHILVWD